MPSVPTDVGVSQKRAVFLDHTHRSQKSRVLSAVPEQAKFSHRVSLLQFRYELRPADVCS